MPIHYDYFYGNESEQFTFYRIPKAIITSPDFSNLSYGTKLLYGLLLDRMGLSIKNGWFDKNSRAYIIYSVKEIMENLNCSKGTAVKMLSELETIGLIERKKRGQGFADYIYVKKFFTSHKNVVQNLNFKKSKAYTSCGSKDELQEVHNSDCNNTDRNYNNFIYTESSSSRAEYEELVKENIEYDILQYDYPKEWLDNIVSIMADVLSSKSETIRINKENVSTELVKKRFMEINDQHIIYLDDAMRRFAPDVKNIRAFLITALYNAPTTMDAFYDAWVKSDMKGEI